MELTEQEAGFIHKCLMGIKYLIIEEFTDMHKELLNKIYEHFPEFKKTENKFIDGIGKNAEKFEAVSDICNNYKRDLDDICDPGIKLNVENLRPYVQRHLVFKPRISQN